MTTVPSNLIPTRITQLPEYAGSSTAGYLPYVIDGITYKVQFSNIAAVGAVPSTRTITGGSGLTGGGDLSADRVISIAAGGVGFSQLADSGVAAGTYGDSANIPVLTVDVKGRVTVASTTPINLSAYVPTSRSIIAGTGLSGGGTLAADRTISLTLSSATPQSGGVPSAGSGTVAAREDHVHPAVDLSDTTETSGVLPMSRGGTGDSLSPVAGALVYSDGSKFDLTTLGSAGQALFGNGAGAPTWHTISTSLSGLTMGFVGANYTLSGTLGITSGGTGATTAAAALANLLPSYGGNAGKILAVNGSATGVEWVTSSAGGTVTSVNVSGGTTGLTTSGGPVTAAGTITLAGTLAAANGGTGLTSPGTAGNVLTSNGTAWTSSAPAGGGGSSLTAVASGTLADGSTVVINADGTVSVVGGVSQALGSPTLFSVYDEWVSAAYDSNAQRVVIAYADVNNSNFGTAIVGTVSGTSITFGTPVVFASSNTMRTGTAYDSGTQKVVICYTNASIGKAIVGTVSGTSISFGTAVVFEATQAQYPAITYDSSAQRVVIAYQDSSYFGTAIVGTVSGTSISFGTAVVFESAGTIFISVAYDSNAQRIVIAYRDQGNSNFGTAIVGTVSGTSISFGTAVVFESATTGYTSVTYDSNAQRVVIAYADAGNSSFGTAIVGTVSGTSISFGTAVVFKSANVYGTAITYDSNAQRVVLPYGLNSNGGEIIVGTVSGTSISFNTAVVFESLFTDYLASAYDSVAQRVVVPYVENTVSGSGFAVVFRTATQNLTSENFIGFSNAAYTNGQTATIQLVGAVDDAQTGLTPGQSYYVQTDGTLSTTPGSPSVFAGTAVAATKIIVKG